MIANCLKTVNVFLFRLSKNRWEYLQVCFFSSEKLKSFKHLLLTAVVRSMTNAPRSNFFTCNEFWLIYGYENCQFGIFLSAKFQISNNAECRWRMNAAKKALQFELTQAS